MKNQKQTKKNNAAKKPTTENSAPSRQKPPDMSQRVLTMADYREMEKVAKSIETACRIRRKYVMAMQTATDMIDRNLDKLREIVWNNND